MYIRRMEARDVEAVVTLWDTYALEAANQGLLIRLSAVREGLHKMVDSEVAACFVAEENGVLVGFTLGYLTQHPVWDGRGGEIEELYVTPSMRRRGVATALVNALAAWLRGQGADVLWAYAMHESREAVAFWRSTEWESDMTMFRWM